MYHRIKKNGLADGRNINNLIYTHDIILQAENSEDLEQLLQKVIRKCQSRFTMEHQEDKSHGFAFTFIIELGASPKPVWGNASRQTLREFFPQGNAPAASS